MVQKFEATLNESKQYSLESLLSKFSLEKKHFSLIQKLLDGGDSINKLLNEVIVNLTQDFFQSFDQDLIAQLFVGVI